MNREIKFKVWHPTCGMGKPIDIWAMTTFKYKDKGIKTLEAHFEPECVFLQFTGLCDKDGKEIYDSDIFRVEENVDIECDVCDGTGSVEGGEYIENTCLLCDGSAISRSHDRIYYLIITWVKEWCMFATLTIDEYTDYQSQGIEALDEPMFWTYTLEDTDSRKFFLCGNLHENPELLEKV